MGENKIRRIFQLNDRSVLDREKRKIKEVFIKIYRFKSKQIRIVNNETQTL